MIFACLSLSWGRLAALASIPCLLWLSPVTAQARIGESPEECVERYGPVLETFEARVPGSDPEGQKHRKSGIDILVEFRDAKAWLIRFEKRDLTTAQQESLLNANSGDSSWLAPFAYLSRRQWKLESGEMHALARPGRYTVVLEILTDACLRARDWRREERLELVGTEEGSRLQAELLEAGALEGF